MLRDDNMKGYKLISAASATRGRGNCEERKRYKTDVHFQLPFYACKHYVLIFWTDLELDLDLLLVVSKTLGARCIQISDLSLLFLDISAMPPSSSLRQPLRPRRPVQSERHLRTLANTTKAAAIDHRMPRFTSARICE